MSWTQSCKAPAGSPSPATSVTNFCSRSILRSTSSAGCFGRGYWSLSAYAKKRVKDAVNFIGEYEKAIVRYAERERVDAVLCGHIHNAAIRQIGSVTYYNCGDWVESCCALVEEEYGEIELLNFSPLAARITHTTTEITAHAF